MRFCDPKTGRIYMEGKDYLSLRPEELRQKIAMVPQQVNLFLRFNPGKSADGSPGGQQSDASGGSWRKRALENLSVPWKKALDSEVGNAGSALSGGQRQKMGIARALLSKAEYLIFDEATSSVDPESEREIWKTIGELAHSQNADHHFTSDVLGEKCRLHLCVGKRKSSPEWKS